jgi:hypothetical protein
VAGYQLNPQLVAEADAVELAKLDVAPCPVVLREVFPDEAPAGSPFVANLASRWRGAGSEVDAQAVRGPSFWVAQEIEEAPRLLDATTGAVLRHLSTPAGVAS